MPYDSNGNYTLPNTYFVENGDTVLPIQHNPALEDIQAALSSVLLRSGVAPMSGDLNINGFKLKNLADGAFPTDAVSLRQLDGRTTRGYLFGLTLSNNAVDAVNDIDVAPGAAASDDTSPVFMALSASITKRLDALWVAGSGNGGLDTGAVANSTYHVWIIQRSDTGAVDILFSTSATAPTMPANYDRKRRIGAVVRLSGSILAFRQNGNRFMLSAVQPIYTGVGNVTNAQLATFGPSGVRYRPILQLALASNANSLAAVQLGDGELSSISSNVQTIGGTGSANNTAIIDEFYTDTSGRIRHSVIISAGSLSSYSVFSIGWLDDRGERA